MVTMGSIRMEEFERRDARRPPQALTWPHRLGGTGRGGQRVELTTAESRGGATLGSGLWRPSSWVNNLRAARAREPDLPIVLPTVQITAPLVLSDEGH